LPTAHAEHFAAGVANRLDLVEVSASGHVALSDQQERRIDVVRGLFVMFQVGSGVHGF
jgi:hypothetical protein